MTMIAVSRQFAKLECVIAGTALRGMHRIIVSLLVPAGELFVLRMPFADGIRLRWYPTATVRRNLKVMAYTLANPGHHLAMSATTVDSMPLAYLTTGCRSFFFLRRRTLDI